MITHYLVVKLERFVMTTEEKSWRDKNIKKNNNKEALWPPPKVQRGGFRPHLQSNTWETLS